MFFVLFVLALVAAIVLYALLGNPSLFIRLRHDTRGVVSVAGTFLQERSNNCGLSSPPGPRYPAYSKSFGGTFDANGNAEYDLEAERDLLLTGLSIDSESSAGSVRVSATYCGVTILNHVSMRTFPVCCDRKPIFLQGIREGKSLHFTLSGGTAADDWAITVYGMQGKGCCP